MLMFLFMLLLLLMLADAAADVDAAAAAVLLRLRLLPLPQLLLLLRLLLLWRRRRLLPLLLLRFKLPHPPPAHLLFRLHFATYPSLFFLSPICFDRINKMFGIGDLAFAIGDDSIADFVASIQFLPIVQMVRKTPGLPS